ncbi:MAG TPA: UDP-N-acetylmuramate dehydrogenase [Granulicella sp.]|nr:UDP-N-acetylmuramate dehydrogenase [Granulicella sp.]
MQENVPLAPLTTLRIGGPARFFAPIASEDDLLEAVHFAQSRNLPLFVLGGGSNLLVSDLGYDGVVLHIALTGAPDVIEPQLGNPIDYTVPAGNDWDAFVLSVCQQGIAGIECLAGIPGQVGGTPVQNVGAYGQEVAGTITQVRALDLQALEFVTLSAADCHFSYRHSRFNSTDRGRYAVTSVTFRLDPGATPNLGYADLKQHFAAASTPPTPLDVYHAVRAIRHRKGMLLVEGEPDCRSAGSFFKNPVVPADALPRVAAALELDPAAVPHWPAPGGLTKLPAAWLLERAGFHKGYALGAAGISSRHTLALINRGDATQADLIALRDRIQQTIHDRFAIQLEQEPVMLP